MNQTYRYKKTLKTVDVNKELLVDIERYCFKKLPELINVSEDEIRKVYKTTIEEINGEQQFDLIDNYEFKQFPDDTKKISTGFSFFDFKKDIEFTIHIYFGLEAMHSSVDIKIKSDNAREKAMGISQQLDRIINERKNMNFIFNPSLWLGFTITVFGIFLLSFSPLLFKYNMKAGFASLFIVFMICAYFWLFKNWKPFCSFDTNRQNRNDKIANYFLLGILSFIIFSTGLYFIRKLIIGA